MTAPSLVLGDLDLAARLPQGATFAYHALAGTEFGNATPELAITSSFLSDGDDERIDRFGNVGHAIRLRIEGPSHAALEEAEALLERELYKRNSLAWTPPGGFAATTVFDVVTSWSEHHFDDWDEIARIPRRHFTLHVRRLPWPRSVDPLVVVAESIAPDPVEPDTFEIWDGSSAAGWFADGPNSTISSDGSKLIVSSVTTGPRPIESGLGAYQRFDPPFLPYDFVNDLGLPLISLDWWRVGATTEYPWMTVVIDGVRHTCERVAQAQAAPGSEFMRYWWRVPPGPVREIKFNMRVRAPGDTDREFWLDQVTAWSNIPTIGSGRQQFRSIEVPGTAPTEAAIRVEHETDALGDVLIHTAPADSGYQPATAQYRTAGGTVAPTASTMSGSWRKLNEATPETYDIPIDAIPVGTYAMLAVLKGDAPGTQLVEWDASTLVGAVEHESVHGFASRSLTASAAIYDLGTVSLPTVPAGSDAKVRIKLYSDGASDVDELWLLNLTDGRMSLVSCGTGTPATGGASNRLWIETPSLDLERQAYFVGTEEDRSDRRHASANDIRSFQVHEMEPGAMNVFVASTGAVAPAVSAELYPRWRHNAGA